MGVAPKANILGIKTLDENGSGNTSKIIAAISYIVGNKDKYNNLSPKEIKERIRSTCVDLKDSEKNQGSGMLDLKILFNDEKETSTKSIPPGSSRPSKSSTSSTSSDSGGELFNNIIMILIVMFLLDSKF